MVSGKALITGTIASPIVPGTFLLSPVGQLEAVNAVDTPVTHAGPTACGPPVALIDQSPLPTGHGDLTFTSPFFTLQVSGVPEPVTPALFGAGLAGIGALRRRKA